MVKNEYKLVAKNDIMNELISIIVPIHNGEKTLENCVETIIKQTYYNIEILLIDDGSSDKTMEICQKLQEKDKRIRYFYKENSGVSSTRNYGIDKSKGKYIAFVDCDDTIDEDYIFLMYKVAKEQDVDVVRCKAKRITKKSHNIHENLFGFENKKINKEQIDKFIMHIIVPKESINAYCWVLLIKKECIVKFNTDLYFMEDTEFTIRLLKNINSIYFLDEELYLYNYNEKSASKNKENIIKNINGIIRTNSQIKNDLKINEDNKVLKEINTQCFNLIFAKLKLMDTNKCSDMIKIEKEIFENKDIKKIIHNLDFNDLSRIKKIEYMLTRHKCYFLLALIIKITTLKEN